MLNIIKEKLDLSPDLRKKINWASKYTSTPITLEKGHLIDIKLKSLFNEKIDRLSELGLSQVPVELISNGK